MVGMNQIFISIFHVHYDSVFYFLTMNFFYFKDFTFMQVFWEIHSALILTIDKTTVRALIKTLRNTLIKLVFLFQWYTYTPKYNQV